MATTSPWTADRTAATRPLMAFLLPVLLMAVVLLADQIEGPKTAFVGVLVSAPLLAAVLGPPRTVVLVAVVTLLAAGAFGLVADDGFVWAQATRLGIIALLSVVAVVAAVERVRAERRLADADRVVAAVTEAIIRPLPPSVGGVGLASRYLGADAEAHVGGDFYEVLDTPHGVRVVMGDVRGKGLSAVRMANYVLGAFRAAARRDASLTDVVALLEDVVATEGSAEDFVTAVVLEVRDGTVHGVSCGHPPPVLLDGGAPRDAVLPVDVPLGLGAGGTAPAALPPGTSGLLLHSDGLTEARRPGGPFLDLDQVLRDLSGARGDRLLGGLVEAVRDHVGGRLRDDVALLWLDVGAVTAPRGPAGEDAEDAEDASRPGELEPAALRTGRRPLPPAAR
ncbi:PP2C family protein-serine/threonine phosphatase [Aquipuribacter hungaricus]|uniref:PP2C family protein-serine/threonine phosphatase n=1 Tax=Aquipuribacter hungaricus TaxID=545624 RepID=A0ABV7WBQ5_9MICO